MSIEMKATQNISLTMKVGYKTVSTHTHTYIHIYICK